MNLFDLFLRAIGLGKPPEAPAQWCPDCGEKMSVTATRLYCSTCGFVETNPEMK